MDKKFKQITKEMIKEDLCGFTNNGVSTLSVGDVPPPEQNPQVDDPEDDEAGSNTGNNSGEGGNDGKGGGSENSSGGGLNNGRPIPNVGVGGWSFGR